MLLSDSSSFQCGDSGYCRRRSCCRRIEVTRMRVQRLPRPVRKPFRLRNPAITSSVQILARLRTASTASVDVASRVSDNELASALPAVEQPRQQSGPSSRRSLTWAQVVRRDHLLEAFKLLPGNVAFVMARQQCDPLLSLSPSRFGAGQTVLIAWFVLTPSVRVRATVNLIGHDLIEHRIDRPLPRQFALRIPHRKLQSFLDKPH